jgi:hypothetical protein
MGSYVQRRDQFPDLVTKLVAAALFNGSTCDAKEAMKGVANFITLGNARAVEVDGIKYRTSEIGFAAIFAALTKVGLA